MRYLPILLLLMSCTKEDIPCIYTLKEIPQGIQVYIDSSDPYVEVCYYCNDTRICRRTIAHYYNCMTVSRCGYPMVFEINGCKQTI